MSYAIGALGTSSVAARAAVRVIPGAGTKVSPALLAKLQAKAAEGAGEGDEGGTKSNVGMIAGIAAVVVLGIMLSRRQR